MLTKVTEQLSMDLDIEMLREIQSILSDNTSADIKYNLLFSLLRPLDSEEVYNFLFLHDTNRVIIYAEDGNIKIISVQKVNEFRINFEVNDSLAELSRTYELFSSVFSDEFCYDKQYKKPSHNLDMLDLSDPMIFHNPADRDSTTRLKVSTYLQMEVLRWFTLKRLVEYSMVIIAGVSEKNIYFAEGTVSSVSMSFPTGSCISPIIFHTHPIPKTHWGQFNNANNLISLKDAYTALFTNSLNMVMFPDGVIYCFYIESDEQFKNFCKRYTLANSIEEIQLALIKSFCHLSILPGNKSTAWVKPRS